MRYKVYDTNIDFKIFETLEKPNEIIHFVDGAIDIGDISQPQFKYQIVNASLTISNSDVILDLLAEKLNNSAVNNEENQSEYIESNLYFSLEPPKNWTYETYSNSYMTDFIGFGPKNAITLYPKEFGNDFLEKEGEKIGAISSFVQDTRYPIKNAPLSEYMKYKNEELGLKTTLQENVTLYGQEAIKVQADGLGSYHNIKHIFYYVIYENQPYYISYSADIQNFIKYLHEFEKMVKSFKFQS